jgi:hypothetical protein
LVDFAWVLFVSRRVDFVFPDDPLAPLKAASSITAATSNTSNPIHALLIPIPQTLH